MPSYKVISRGFYNGAIYDPEGKRKTLHTENPFPSKDKKEQVPSWLEAIKGEAAPTVNRVPEGPTVKELKEKLTALDVKFKGNASKATLTELLETAETAAKVAQDKKDIADASFMGDGEGANNNSNVETL